jgi:hypothetical protein
MSSSVSKSELRTCELVWIGLNLHERGYRHGVKRNVIWWEDKGIRHELSRNIWTRIKKVSDERTNASDDRPPFKEGNGQPDYCEEPYLSASA